jgi:hypothetical protein
MLVSYTCKNESSGSCFKESVRRMKEGRELDLTYTIITYCKQIDLLGASLILVDMLQL